jgi:hypothetical protein
MRRIRHAGEMSFTHPYCIIPPSNELRPLHNVRFVISTEREKSCKVLINHKIVTSLPLRCAQGYGSPSQ